MLRWLAGWSIESPSKTCSFERETEQVRVSAEVAKLGLLADNAGPADTHGLTSGSVAIDRTPEAACRDADPGSRCSQRGRSSS